MAKVDHAFQASPCGRYCLHRTKRGWLGAVACGYAKSDHPRARKERVNLSVSVDTVEKLDEIAEASGLTRYATVNALLDESAGILVRP